MNTWTVGQQVVIVEPGHREAQVSDAEITKVGRKWLTVKVGPWFERRFDFAGRAEGHGGRRAQLYADRAEHEASVARNRAWNDFKALMNRTHAVPAHLSADDIASLIAAVTPRAA